MTGAADRRNTSSRIPWHALGVTTGGVTPFRALKSAMRILLVLALSWVTADVAFGDDYNRIIRLEQDVRNLERQVSTLERELDELRRKAGGGRVEPGRLATASSAPSDTWIDAKKWRTLTIGTSEMDVIELLGPPTSMRAQDDARVLLYAIEIGSSGFLSGSVTLKDRRVTAIELPTLK